MIDFILSIELWQWRDEQILWFAILPFVWWLLSRLVKLNKDNHYADSHLLAWVKVDVHSGIKDNFHITKGEGGAFRWIIQLIKKILNPILMLSLAWVFIVIALAGPRSAVPAPEESSRSGVDILLVLDLSLSMTAQDVKPNRFLFARSLMESLSNRLEPNDRLGLLAYAGQPHLVSPLSFDRNLFQHYLALVRPGMLPTKGSQIKPAISYGISHLQQTAGKSNVLVVFTDGEPENFVQQPEPEGFSELIRENTKVILVGIGERARVKIPDAEHKSGYLHVSGLLANTRLEEAFLQELATKLVGGYFKANISQNFIKSLLKEIAIDAEARSFQTNKTVWQDHAMPFIWIAFFALLLAFYPIKIRTKIVPVLLIGLSLNFFTQESMAESRALQIEQQAYSAFFSKDYDLSQQLYSEVDNFNGFFGAGSAAYQSQDYESAVLYFRQSALLGVSVGNRSDSLFNLGNSYYRANLLSQAIEAYEQALKYLPNNSKTLHNLALAKKRRLVEKNGQQQKDEQGDGKGKGSTSQDDEGAFYGGQKPSEEAGEGIAGDAQEGEKQGENLVLPDERNDTDFILEQPDEIILSDMGNAIIAKQKQIQRMEKFEQKMLQTQDQQSKLLIGIFEREEDYQASQSKAHVIPGVKPW